MQSQERDGRTVMVAMSGGVDSTVTALLLLREGYRCMGGMMRTYRQAGYGEQEEDIADGEAAARVLSIPFRVFDFTAEFRQTVVADFVRCYEEGLTPNPCIVCNRELKFGRLLTEAEKWGADKLATGHYARILYDEETGLYRLCRALDRGKDQSYVLWNLMQTQLARLLFPLGELTKEQVRRLAEQSGLTNARKRDSQDICFVPDGDYVRFIQEYTGKEYPWGDFIGPDGRVLGQHRGLIGYTVGQRKGLGLSLPAPLYVERKDAKTNTVYLCENEQLFTDTVTVREAHFILQPSGLTAPLRALARIRYSHKEQPALLTPLGEGRIGVTFETPQRAPTPGQSAVFYSAEDGGDTVLGGGIIE